MSEIDQNFEPQEDRAQRAALLFDEMRMRIFKQTDRLFAGLMVLQWLGGIVAALCLSPRTWAGSESYVNIHVWAAVFLGGALACLPVALVLLCPGSTLTRHVIAVCEMLFSALLIDLTGGRIETHFHVFGALALLAFYRDWRVLITASAVVAIHHGIFGVLAPQDVYGVYVIQPWRWVEHTGWVFFEDVFLIISIGQGLKEMTGLAQRQASLRESEANLRKIFDATPDMIMINRLRDSTYVNVNTAFERSGVTRAEALRAYGTELRKMLNGREWETYLARLKADGAVQNMETEVRLRNGRAAPSLVSGAIIELDGEPCAVTIVRDITRLKETECELVAAREVALAASHAKSEFLSSMSHEIRTPMNAILGMAELLEETPLNRDQKKFLGIMRNNGDALLCLINDILDLAKVEAGLVLERVDFDLESLTDKTVETLGVRAHAKGLELAVHLMPDVPRQLGGDPLRLRQILINLIGNAIKFTETGQVLLTVERDPAGDGPGALLFRVSDTGIGIATDKLDAVFSNFTQADSSTTRRYGGSGLGLAIAKRLVALMNGRIWAESELGMGSTFHFTARFEVSDAPRAVEPSTVALMLSGTRALVVDDNATNRLILREMLSSRGAEVSEAEDGPQGLALLKRARLGGQPFKLLLLDCRMPRMDGFQVAERIRTVGYDGMSILMLTSDDLKVELARVGELGLDGYLVKPVRRLDLFDAIAAAIDSHNGDSPGAGEPPPAAPSAVTADAPRQHPLRILLTDDAGDNRVLIRAYLRNSQAQIDDAENGMIAVGKAQAEKYDLILMDIQMPVMDGLEAIRLIRECERAEGGRHRIPIVALTASALESDVRRSLDAGADLHVSKPVKKATLLAAIESVMLVSSSSAWVSPEQDHQAGRAETARRERDVA